MQTLLTHEDLKELQCENILCDFIIETLSVWINYASKKRGTKGTWVHDALTIAYALDSSIADFDECYAYVICDSSLARGMSWRCFKEPKMSMGVDLSTKNCVKILKNLDNTKLLKLIKYRLLKGVYYENYKSITA